MKLPVRDFLCMTLWQYIIAREYHERAMIESWRQTRLSIHSMAMVMGGKKSVATDPTKFLPLPFDEDFDIKKDPKQQEKENLLILAKFKQMGYLKPFEDGQ
jgi:hypothetical protein